MALITIQSVIDHALFIAMHGDITRSINILNELLKIFPDNKIAHIERGRLFLKMGLFEEGINDFEFFYNHSSPSLKKIFTPLNLNNSIYQGKTILLTSDAGYGDLIQFVRYAILMKALGANVVLECDPLFFSLFKNNEWIDYCTPLEEIQFHYDLRIKLHSLFGAFDTNLYTIPFFSKYLFCSFESTENYKFPKQNDKLNLGLSWRSTNENSSSWTTGREISLEQLLTSIDSNLFNIVSVQKEINHEEYEILKKHSIPITSSSIRDFNDTAGVISNCDIIVSTDNVIPHLSGAMGIPTCTLLSTNSCWRWLTNRTDSPWYPSMHLFRQKAFGDWTHPLVDLTYFLRCFYTTLNHKGDR